MTEKTANPSPGARKPAGTPDLVRRQEAAMATLAKYRGRAFDWKTGQTCIHMARFHLRRMGHRPEPLPRIRGLIGARKALDARGWQTCADVLDALLLPRIPAAAMLPGDIAFRSSEDGLGGLLVCAGAHKLMGWFENAPGFVVMDMSFDQVEACWRV